MSACMQELCRNWTGQGCACEVLNIEPDIVGDDPKMLRNAPSRPTDYLRGYRDGLNAVLDAIMRDPLCEVKP